MDEDIILVVGWLLGLLAGKLLVWKLVANGQFEIVQRQNANEYNR